MQSNYEDMENKIKEVYKIIYAMEQVINVAEKYERNTEYINVPMDMLKKEINDLSEKINHLKDDMIVTYEEDLSYIDQLINQKKDEEIRKRSGKEWINKKPIDENEDKDENIPKSSVWSKLKKNK